VVIRIIRDAAVTAFGDTSVVVIVKAATMIILVRDAAMGAAVALDADLMGVKITSVRLLDATLT